MLLEVTLVAGTGAAATELSVTWPPGAAPGSCSGQSLAQALARHWAGCSFSIGGRPLTGLQAGRPPLVNGAVVVAWPVHNEGPPAARAGTAAAAIAPAPPGPLPGAAPVPEFDGIAAVLTVSAGPDAGAVFALRRGTFSLGRGQCRIAVADPALSRHHGTLVVGTRSITLAATRHSTGFTICRTGGSPTAGASAVKGSVAVAVGDAIGCGSSCFEIRFLDHHAVPGENVAPGSIGPAGGTGTRTTSGAFSPAPSGEPLLDAGALEPRIVQHSPGPQRNQTALMAAGCLPLLLGVVLALATGSWMFLAFAGMGAVAVLIPLFGGGKRRRAFLAAVERAAHSDAGRMSRTFPDAGTLMLSAHAGMAPTPGSSPLGGIALRLGTATQAAHLALASMDPSFSAPLLPRQPFCVCWDPGPLTVQGPANAVGSLLNFVLMQLDAAAVPVVLLGAAGRLPPAARFLPHTVLATSAAAAQQALNRMGGGILIAACAPSAVLVVADRTVRLPVLPPGLRVLFFVADGSGGSPGTTNVSSGPTALTGAQPPGPGPSAEAAGAATIPVPGHAGSSGTGLVSLVAAGNRVEGTFGDGEFVPDGVALRIFDAYARARAGTAAGPGSAPPAPFAAISLPEQCSVNAVLDAWRAGAGGPLRTIPLGQSVEGPAMFDFVHDGPHLLVAGTTGSGKSEFLRALIGSLAAAHSPADLAFIFIDFKGGAGLGALSRLPHTTSLITDLGGHGMERTLASLQAELRHREAALARAGAPDSDQYRASALARPSLGGPPQPGAGPAGLGAAHAQRPAVNSHPMAHLVVVIDEFRVLVDQHPAALAELMRLATVGRSLGIHLVMSTQRPQGALNADIRANVTSSICLRVQSAADSTDVIGTASAAAIGVSTPGRGFISRAGTAPEEFQSATLRSPEPASGELPLVEFFAQRLRAGDAADPVAAPRTSDVDAVTQLLGDAWRAGQAADASLRGAPAVIAPELPAALTLAGTVGGGRGGGAGSSAAGGSCAVLLGMVDVPERQSLEHLLWHPEHHSHLACFGTTAETSAAVSLAAAQLLAANTRLRSGASAEGRLLYLLDGDGSLAAHANNPWVGSYVTTDQLRTAARLALRLRDVAAGSTRTLVLCISDWGRWAAALRSSPWQWAEDAIAELIRFTNGDLVVAVGGGRELLTSHFLAAIPNRLFLRCGSSAESTMLWPRLPRFAATPGCAAIAGPINASAAHSDAETMHIAQLGTAPHGRTQEQSVCHRLSGNHAARTLLVTPLPTTLTMEELQTAFPGRHGAAGHNTAGDGEQPPGKLFVGLGGDGHELISLVLAPGALVPVLGGSRTGKTTFLNALCQLNGARMMPPLPPDDPAGILLLDDAASLAPRQQEQVSALLAAGASVVAALPYPHQGLSRLPPEWGIRTLQQGIVLMPHRPSDAELLGVRLDTAGSEPPGRGVLVDGGLCSWFQFPFPQLLPHVDSNVGN